MRFSYGLTFPNWREGWLWQNGTCHDTWSQKKRNEQKIKAFPRRYQTLLPASSTPGEHRSLTLVMSSLNLLAESDKSNLLLTDRRLGVCLKCIALAPGPFELLCGFCQVGLVFG